MAQTVLSVVFEAAPRSAPLLRDRILALTAAEEATTPRYARLAAAAPSLHFMSITLVEDALYDPVFVVELNFDGPPGPFFAELEAALGEALRDMLRCAKPPPAAGALFAAVTAPGSRVPVAPLLEASAVRPAVFHQGNRGLDRRRIEAEGALFAAARVLADAPALRAMTILAIHEHLRATLAPDFPWLNARAPARIGAAESLGDRIRLLAFALAAVIALAAPAAFFAVIPRVSLTGAPPLVWPTLVVGAMALSVTVGLLWLRALEKAEPTQDEPSLDPALQAAMARGEDRTVQNHMISIVHIKPGVLRAVLVRAGLWGLGLLLRANGSARAGYLAGMRTIHFAHWALIGAGGRLMFHSNYDSSWESYLDDFIEKAHAGLTLAWTNGVGFPRTRLLVGEGASRGRLFKAWARRSMTRSQFWFTAYKAWTVNQIERQARLADGLRRASLTPSQADAWVLDL
ncbi:MAG: hypothetical protein ABI242_00195 [Caulobacteraceae bacterium]